VIDTARQSPTDRAIAPALPDQLSAAIHESFGETREAGDPLGGPTPRQRSSAVRRGDEDHAPHEGKRFEKACAGTLLALAP
jgi:hypothetical protein